jgi:hypothetical protein
MAFSHTGRVGAVFGLFGARDQPLPNKRVTARERAHGSPLKGVPMTINGQTLYIALVVVSFAALIITTLVVSIWSNRKP